MLRGLAPKRLSACDAIRHTVFSRVNFSRGLHYKYMREKLFLRRVFVICLLLATSPQTHTHTILYLLFCPARQAGLERKLRVRGVQWNDDKCGLVAINNVHLSFSEGETPFALMEKRSFFFAKQREERDKMYNMQ